MKNVVKLSIIAAGATLLLAGCGSGSAGESASGNSTPSPAASGPAQVVHVQASDFKWTLDKTTFKAGEPIEFDISVAEGAHGFSINGTSVTQQVMMGQTYKIDWTPPSAGTYTIRCDQYCGSGHPNMFTTFTVS